MAEEFVRYFDVDGNKRPIAASNLKKSGRLVIGIAGTHTLDDADILFGANESDAVDNSAKLEAAIQKGGFNEIVFLNGTFHIVNPIQFYGTIRGVGTGALGYGKFTKIIFCGSLNYSGVFSCDNMTLSDFSLYFTDTELAEAFGVYIDYHENVVIERVHFEGFNRAIHIYEGHNIKVSNCITKNCNEGIYCDDGKWVTIQDCHFENDGNVVVNVNSWDEVACPVYLISNRIIGDCCTRNCYIINNDITGDGNLGNNNFTTIGATKLTEGKVKVLNRVSEQAFEKAVFYPKNNKFNIGKFWGHCLAYYTEAYGDASYGAVINTNVGVAGMYSGTFKHEVTGELYYLHAYSEDGSFSEITLCRVEDNSIVPLPNNGSVSLTLIKIY